MNSEDKTLISDRIDKEIKETQEKVEKYRKLSKPISPENAIGRISRMDAINNKSINDRMLRNSLQKLKIQGLLQPDLIHLLKRLRSL